ncbi:MAG: hypothetical protein IPJ77_10085 [Planctomycetes bacterium]|nr:hypothetical protein [Planctomycetota bacterium]
MIPPSTTAAVPRSALSTLQRVVLGTLAVGFVGSVLLRAVPETRTGTGPAGSSFVGNVEAETVHEAQGLETYLPYLTEATLFGLIGFALGYASRKLFKVALILIAVAFVVVQLLVWKGWLTVDWLGVRTVLNDWIFNLKENETITRFLTNRVPSAGALLFGWFVGFRRG